MEDDINILTDSMVDVSEFAGNVAQTVSLSIQGPATSENRRKREFLSLVSAIAEQLVTKDVNEIIWHRQLPPSLNDKPALEILTYLYKHGVFTEFKVQPLAQLLKDIHREDLAGRVKTFLEQFGCGTPLTDRHYSMPNSSASQHAQSVRERRANTLSSCNPSYQYGGADVTTIVTAQEANLESITGTPTPGGESVFNSPPQNFQPVHQKQWSYPCQTIVETQPLAMPQQYTSSNMPRQGINHSPAISRLTSEGNVRSYAGSTASLHTPLGRNVSVPVQSTRQSLSASNSQVELLPLQIAPNQHPQATQNGSHPLTWQLSSNFSSRNVSEENMQSVLHSETMDPNFKMFQQQRVILPQHSGGDLQVYGQRVSSHVSLNSLPTPNTSPEHNYMIMQPYGLDPQRHTLNSPMHALPMTRSKSQVYNHKPAYTHICTPGFGHKRSNTFGSRLEYRQEFHHSSSPNFADDNLAVHVTPQQIHSPHCPHCGQANYTVTVKRSSCEEGNNAQIRMSTGNMQDMGSVEKQREGGECTSTDQNQASLASDLELAAHHHNPTQHNIGKSECDTDKRHTDLDSYESSAATLQEGIKNSHQGNTSAKTSLPKKSENDSVSNPNFTHHTPTLSLSKKRVPVDNRPSSAIVGKDHAATVSERSLTSMDTLTTSMPHLKTTQGGSPKALKSGANLSTHEKPSRSRAGSAKSRRGLTFFTSKPKAHLLEANKLVWPVKRDELNKCIYKHTNKLLTCNSKLEVVPLSDQDNGPLPKLQLQLHPYGTEEDGNQFVTAKVSIEFPSKCRLHSETRIDFKINATEGDPHSRTGTEVVIGHLKTQREKITQSFFYVKRFISHEDLKNSQCEYIYVTATVNLTNTMS